MPIASSSLYDGRSRPNTERPSTVPVRAIVVLVASVTAAWIAAGSTGLLAHPLRHAFCWTALAVAIVAGWPRRDQSPTGWLVLAVAGGLGLIMTASTLPAVNVLAVTLLIAVLARSQAGLCGRVILVAALATAVLGIFRLASTSIPTVWLMANAIGRGLGWLAGTISGEPLWIGASFGGVDFLVLMAALYAGWLICTAPPRLPRAIYAAAAIFFGHSIYLVVLAFSNEIVAALPDVVLPPESDNSRLGVWAWGNAVRTLLPWNLPALAGLIHLTIAVVMFRWATWLPVVEPAPESPTGGEEEKGLALLTDALLKFGPAVLAVVIPLLTVLGLSKADLTGKTIVAYQQGFLDWEKPEHDTQSPGSYGMLPLLIESLGGTFDTSTDLSHEDLDKTDVLLMLHPNQDWSKEKEALDRVWEFVRRGGSLLVAAEPRIHEGDSESTFNDVLRPTAMQVRYDTAISETGNWEHSLETLAHPATSGIDDRRNRFGLVTGSSIQTRWPARPILVGRFGWSDPGSDAANTGISQYDPGEKLGDLVLAAEQRVGQGRIFVLGDTSSLHNDVIANSYMFAGRLLGYLAGKPGSPQAGWRQLLGLLAMVALVGLLAWGANAVRTAVAAVLLAVCLTCCVTTSHRTARVLPDGRDHSPNNPSYDNPAYDNLAYIDASHLEAYSSDTWDDFGIVGLTRTLIRNGYLPLLLPELTSERLERAGLLISIGPARRFSRAELRTVQQFVDTGGTLICMVGAEHAAASRELLEQFDFRIPPSPVPPTDHAREPEPLGFFRTIYVDTDDYKVVMQSYSAWEVECGDADAQELVRWSNGKEDRPFIISRFLERGAVVLIGDTYLATNQNLESVEGQLSENVTFWRWLLTWVAKRQEWIPPNPNPETEPPDEPTSGDPANREAAP